MRSAKVLNEHTRCRPPGQRLSVLSSRSWHSWVANKCAEAWAGAGGNSCSRRCVECGKPSPRRLKVVRFGGYFDSNRSHCGEGVLRGLGTQKPNGTLGIRKSLVELANIDEAGRTLNGNLP